MYIHINVYRNIYIHIYLYLYSYDLGFHLHSLALADTITTFAAAVNILVVTTSIITRILVVANPGHESATRTNTLANTAVTFNTVARSRLFFAISLNTASTSLETMDTTLVTAATTSVAAATVWLVEEVK